MNLLKTLTLTALLTMATSASAWRYDYSYQYEAPRNNYRSAQYCEYAYEYDSWGNYVYVWQCN